MSFDPVLRIDRLWMSDGALARALSGFESRPQQAAMARAVADAFEANRTLLVEAGTGTGKTLAYLLPAVLSGKKVVVSTGTRALQDQLAERDIPLVEKVLGRSVAWCVLKGRENYACLYRLEGAAATADVPGGDGRAIASIRTWAQSTEVGDRAELEWLADDDTVWSEASATADQCIGVNCPWYEPCFVTRAKRRAASADLVIVNHALFFSDVSAGPHVSGSIVPRHGAVVFDEAHLLEDVATAHWGVGVSQARVRDLLADLHREPWPSEDAPDRSTFSASVDRCRLVALRAFEWVRALAFEAGAKTQWVPDHAADAAAAGLDAVIRLGELATLLEETAACGAGWERLSERTGALLRDMRFLWRADDPSYVYWMEAIGSGVRLSASPLDVSARLRDAVFQGGAPCVLTSATLTAGGTFAYLRARLGVDDADEAIFPSPFDFSSQSLLYVPEKFPLPSEPRFPAAVADEVVRIVEAVGGRAFVLMTSRRSLEQAARSCRGRIRYPVYIQGEAPRMTLINQFKREPSVLFATMGFWQGIDVPGEALSCVVLEKLPFAPPDDPIIRARSDVIRRAGENPFSELFLPSAAIWLKQGFGRLIRARTDHGVIAFLDRRILTHRYGDFFLASLPPAPLTTSFNDVETFFSSQHIHSSGSGDLLQ